MRYINNAKIIKVSRMLEDMIINDDIIIINNDSNSSINDLDNKNLKNKKRNESTNITMITQKLDFDEVCNLYIRVSIHKS